jgi:hypothetical protein
MVFVIYFWIAPYFMVFPLSMIVGAGFMRFLGIIVI